MALRVFADRAEAGRELAAVLARRDFGDPVLLALPRGGVPVAREIARVLGAPIDLVLVRKIGLPQQREIAAAAVVDGGDAEIIYNRDVMEAAGLDEAAIAREAVPELAEIERRRAAYLGDRVREPLERRTLIIVDDGIATGATMRAAITALRRKSPRRLVVAVPVAAADVVAELARVVDEVICLTAPEVFFAVGRHYDDFRQLTDREVVAALREADAERRARSPSR